MGSMKDTPVGVSIRIPYRILEVIRNTKPKDMTLNAYMNIIIVRGIEALEVKLDGRGGKTT